MVLPKDMKLTGFEIGRLGSSIELCARSLLPMYMIFNFPNKENVKKFQFHSLIRWCVSSSGYLYLCGDSGSGLVFLILRVSFYASVTGILFIVLKTQNPVSVKSFFLRFLRVKLRAIVWMSLEELHMQGRARFRCSVRAENYSGHRSSKGCSNVLTLDR